MDFDFEWLPLAIEFCVSRVVLVSFKFQPLLFALTGVKSKFNKTGTSQVGAISKAQKAQNIFLGKKLEIFGKKISFGKCRTVPKNVKGGPFLIYKHAFCSKITKNSKGGPYGDIKKISKKSLTVPKKNRKGAGETLVPSGLVGNV